MFTLLLLFCMGRAQTPADTLGKSLAQMTLGHETANVLRQLGLARTSLKTLCASPPTTPELNRLRTEARFGLAFDEVREHLNTLGLDLFLTPAELEAFARTGRYPAIGETSSVARLDLPRGVHAKLEAKGFVQVRHVLHLPLAELRALGLSTPEIHRLIDVVFSEPIDDARNLAADRGWLDDRFEPLTVEHVALDRLASLRAQRIWNFHQLDGRYRAGDAFESRFELSDVREALGTRELQDGGAPVATLGLPRPFLTILRRGGYRTVGQVRRDYLSRDLWLVKGAGLRMIETIETALEIPREDRLAGRVSNGAKALFLRAGLRRWAPVLAMNPETRRSTYGDGISDHVAALEAGGFWGCEGSL